MFSQPKAFHSYSRKSRKRFYFLFANPIGRSKATFKINKIKPYIVLDTCVRGLSEKFSS